ncbi:serine protease snake-like [Zophobas morio]|uniref:serine protease snake-like n=1 Tax=Zophobas morio TaxID=2755281 RepID=UPI0030829627
MLKFLFIITVISLQNIYTQEIIGNSCTHESSNSPGLCKLLTQCKEIRDQVVFFHKLPQTCGFEGTQAIVCCPKTRRPGSISESKCLEYVSYTQEKEICGHKIVKRIVGGDRAGSAEFPHMALLGYQSKNSDNLRWLCGGSLISEQHVLTTAHCLFTSHQFDGPKLVLLGVTNINDPNHRQEIKVVEKVAHPDYKRGSVYNDIGLVKLEKPVEMTSYVRPACLYTDSVIHVTDGIATGWGSTESVGRSKSENLLKVTLKIIDHQTCSDSYKNATNLDKGIVNDIQVCTGGGNERKDTCQGDTGGPIQIYHSSDATLCTYDVVGLISFGRACVGAPSVNTRVSYYIKWIEDIVWPDNSQ